MACPSQGDVVLLVEGDPCDPDELYLTEACEPSLVCCLTAESQHELVCAVRGACWVSRLHDPCWHDVGCASGLTCRNGRCQCEPDCPSSGGSFCSGSTPYQSCVSNESICRYECCDTDYDECIDGRCLPIGSEHRPDDDGGPGDADLWHDSDADESDADEPDSDPDMETESDADIHDADLDAPSIRPDSDLDTPPDRHDGDLDSETVIDADLELRHDADGDDSEG
jgi:hypothetical protein